MEYLAARVSVGVDCTHVSKRKGDSCVEECEVAQTVGQGVVVVDGDCEYAVVGLECYACAGVCAFSDNLQLAGGLAA